MAVGVSWRLSPRWRLYGEAGVAYLVRSDTQDQWRLQGGAEYEAAPRVFGGRMAWYVGADLSTLEERGWRMDTSVQSGLVTRTNGRAYRLFVEYYDGRARIGHFTAYSEVTLSTGFRVDL